MGNNNKQNVGGERFGQGDFKELQILEESRLAAVVSEISKTALAHPKNSICKDGSLNSQWNGFDCKHVVLRSLLWLGAIAFHTTETNQFGKIYVGTGEYNIDHSFMIWMAGKLEYRIS